MKNYILQHKKPITITLICLLVVGVLLSTTSYGANTDFTSEHQKIDEQIERSFNSWLASNSMRNFCLPKADLLSQEIEIRKQLGDDTTSLEVRLKNVSENCVEVTKQVLFR